MGSAGQWHFLIQQGDMYSGLGMVLWSSGSELSEELGPVCGPNEGWSWGEHLSGRGWDCRLGVTS